jgi:fructose-1,6-bisphosphatase
VLGGVGRERRRSGNYVVVFDPLDGSSNIDAGVSTGSIYGIYQASTSCLVDDKVEEACIVNVCQPGNALMAAGYCMYSSSCIMVRARHAHAHSCSHSQHTAAFASTDVAAPCSSFSATMSSW